MIVLHMCMNVYECVGKKAVLAKRLFEDDAEKHIAKPNKQTKRKKVKAYFSSFVFF